VIKMIYLLSELKYLNTNAPIHSLADITYVFNRRG
jgi:hypothetical protein